MQLAGMVPQLVLDNMQDGQRIPAAQSAQGMGLIGAEGRSHTCRPSQHQSLQQQQQQRQHCSSADTGQQQQQQQQQLTADTHPCSFTAHLPPGFSAWSALELLPGIGHLM
jgi:hypothetical protein